MRSRHIYLLIMLVCIMVWPTGGAFARDPGIPDTVSFGKCEITMTGPPYEGTLVLPLRLFTDESLLQIDIPLEWSGPMICDSAKFVGERPQYLTYREISIDNVFKIVYAWGQATGDPMPRGEGVLADIYFSLTDTGFVSIDSTDLPMGEAYLHFYDSTFQVVNPQMLQLECRVAPLPGDINGDAEVDIGDVVFLLNYLYREGPPPQSPEAGDINGDCLVDIGDVVYLINFLFRSGPAPKNSCPC